MCVCVCVCVCVHVCVSRRQVPVHMSYLIVLATFVGRLDRLAPRGATTKCLPKRLELSKRLAVVVRLSLRDPSALVVNRLGKSRCLGSV